MGPGQIPRSKIKEYGRDECGLEGDDLEFFMALIRRVDDGYLSDQSSPPDTKLREQVPATNTAGIKGLLRRLAAPKGSTNRFVQKREVGNE